MAIDTDISRLKKKLSLDIKRITHVCQVRPGKENIEIKWENTLRSLPLSLKTKSRAHVNVLIQNDKVSVLKLLQKTRTHLSLQCSFGSKCKMMPVTGKAG